MSAGVSVPWTIFTLVYLAVLFLLGYSRKNGSDCDIVSAVGVRETLVETGGLRRASTNARLGPRADTQVGSDPAVSIPCRT